MLKLMKYEFRKDRNILLVMGGGMLLLELYFLFNVLIKDETHMAIGAVFLTLFSSLCFFMVFLLAVINYSREMNSKSSYLIFMTPNTSYGIIFSKMLTILLLGTAITIIIGALGFLDLNLYFHFYPDSKTFTEMLQEMLNSMGMPLAELLSAVVFEILTFVISFFATIAVVYLAITLSCTFLQNSKLKVLASVVLFLIITYIQYRIVFILPEIYKNPQTTWQMLISLVPALLFNLVVLLGSIFACGQLLDKKVSLG